MRILQLNTQRGWRGGEHQTLLLSRELARRGHDCVVVARPGQPLATRLAQVGLEVLPVSPHTELAIASARTVHRFITRHRVDIVHAHSAHDVMLGALATLGTPARLVVTRTLASRPRPNPFTRWKYGRAEALMAVSGAVAEALTAGGIEPRRLTVVPVGVETERQVAPATGAIMSALGIPGDVPLAVMVAALVPQKDPLTFIRAVSLARRSVPSLHALLVGDGELRGGVEAEIAALGLRGVMHLAGFRPDTDALIARGDVFVLSSRFEGMPLVVLDAFVLGVPVVATAGPGTTELVTDDHTGLVAPVGDAEALGRAMARVVADPVLAARLADAARTLGRAYSVQRLADATERVYATVMSAPMREAAIPSARRSGPRSAAPPRAASGGTA